MERYVVGVVGAHCTGKSTIIQAVKAIGQTVDESQLSRAAQAALGWASLKPAQESQENMWELQDAILEAMKQRDDRINNSKIVTLVDRSPADVWGYTRLWMTRLGEDKINQLKRRSYLLKCLEMADNYRSQIIIPIRDEIHFVEEPNRADAESRIFHEKEVEDFIFSFGYRFHIVQSIDIDMRVKEVVEYLKSIQ